MRGVVRRRGRGTGIVRLSARSPSGWVGVDLAALLEYRPSARGRSRAIDRRTITVLLKDRNVPLREKTLLALGIEDLELENERGRITVKGNVVPWVHRQSGTARLLPRLISGRTAGPLFLADRRPAPHARGRGPVPDHRPGPPFLRAGRIPVQTGHQDPCGHTLRRLRHSRLTHLAEDGWSAPMLMNLSGHENIRSLAIYTNVSAEHDPARRHR
ncbi:tyrosine-type recombinase/integrase [Actinoallomurus acaciae]|uniref:Tyrosine-type recombinase/integrase n=1 Tax=Actinoallomurus acaciae TaxID=502577 RepID=A0ABV5YNG1_9ACTN